MPAFLPPGEGRPAHKPDPNPFGTGTVVFLLTVPSLCFIFLLWRRASSFRGAVSHQLQTWTSRDPPGTIRLSTDEGPPASEFLEDDYDEDNAGLTIEETLAASRSELSMNPAAHTSSHYLLLRQDDPLPSEPNIWAADEDVPPPPPKQ